MLAVLMLTPVKPRFVVVDSVVRAQLAAVWDATNAAQSERGYCVGYTLGHQWGVPVYRVWAIEPAKVVASSQYGILSECPDAHGIAFLHTHPPVTCTDSCRIGGVDAYECFPSELDQASLDESKEPFGLIQCSREAIVFFFPTRRNNHE